MVLIEVLVRALGRVEGEHSGPGWGRGGLNLFVGCVFVGVRNLGCFAEAANAAAVPGTDEERGNAGGEDVAVEHKLVGGLLIGLVRRLVLKGRLLRGVWGLLPLSLLSQSRLNVPVLAGDLENRHFVVCVVIN